MTIRATFQLILHLHTLTNIQIPHQGLFALQIQLYQLVNGGKNSAIPYRIIDNVFKPSIKARGKADINDTLFRSKIGHIRYSDETIELNDMIIFKIQVDSFPNLNDSEIYIDFTLLFSNRYYSDPHQMQNFEATAIQSCRFKLQSIESGIMHYCQGEFVETYLSEFDFSVFCMLMDYKFAGFKSKKLEPTPKDLKRQKLQDLQEFVGWIQKNYEVCKDPILYMYETYVKPLCSQSYHFQSYINDILKVKKEVKLKISKKFLKTEQVNEKLFFQYLTNFDSRNLSCQDLREDLNQLHTDNFFFVQQIINDFAKDRFIIGKMKDKFKQYMKQKFGQKVFKSVSYGSPKTTSKQHLKVVKSVRKRDITLAEYPIMNTTLFLKKQTQLVGFYEITFPEEMKETSLMENKKSLQSLSKKQNIFSKQEEQVKYGKQLFYDERNMLIVLCHGFQGSSFDMMMIQRGLRQVLPFANYLVSISNQMDTTKDIEQMGEKLALEILSYIDKNMDPENMILSFVGHSMGGIIARSSLKHLKKFDNNLGFFCSLGSPHIGYLNGVDGMIKTGLWFINKWQKIISLQQLSMSDKQNPRDSFLYKLSFSGNLRKFKKIILISSMQDSFVPWHSARICPHKNENSLSKVERQMTERIIGNNIVHRVDINFNVKKNDLDGFIGRTAHINLIIQDNLFKMINWTIPKLFDIQEL